jgi:hypothetical protein
MHVRSAGLRTAIAASALALVIGAAQEASSTEPESQAASFDATQYGDGDGLSQESAVVLKRRSDVGGVASEYVWVRHAYPGSKVLEQALTAWDNGKRYDIFSVKTADGRHLSLWFDITAMYK